MARHNLVFLLGYVTSIQVVQNGDQQYALAYVNVARGTRDVGDHKYHMRCDNPIVMSRNPAVVQEMATWEQYDIVEIKGPIAVKSINKGSYCTHCQEKNIVEGTLVYINPIFAKKRAHKESQDECLEFLSENREVSNQAFIFGTLCRDPKKISPKEGLTVTQYQIALNRKYRIREDAPEIKADFPWVKSYGSNAISDREHLHIGSQIFVDGCLQARKVNRHGVCQHCGEKYDWADKALEIVPFETEYISNFYSDEEVQQNKERAIAERATSALASLGILLKDRGDSIPDDVYTEDDIKAGIESEE